jgi:hypothetical protein
MHTLRLAAGLLTVAAAGTSFGIVTVNDPNDSILSPGGTLTINSLPTLALDGVTSLFVDSNPAENAGSLGSGSLLFTGRHILTAAHVVDDALDGGDGNFVVFNLPAGSVPVEFSVADIAIHPNYNGNILDGYDVAIVTLPFEITPSIPRYSLLPTAYQGQEGGIGVKVGYGRTGQGPTGDTTGADLTVKRFALNRYEADGTAMDTLLGLVPSGLGITNGETQLYYDFDNGEVANDAFGYFLGTTGPFAGGFSTFDDPTGFGDNEGMAAPGDSGGPTFLFDDASDQWRIGGVTSGRIDIRLTDGTDTFAADIDDVLNSSFGEFGFDARLTHPDIQSWILTTIPEPAALACLAPAVLLLGRRRAR